MPAVIPLIIAAAGVGGSAMTAHAMNKGTELAATQGQQEIDMQKHQMEQSGERDAFKDLLKANSVLDSKPYSASVPGMPNFGTALTAPSQNAADVAGAKKLSADAQVRINDPSLAAGGGDTSPSNVSSYFPGTGQTVAGAAAGAIPALLQLYKNMQGNTSTPFVPSQPGQVPFSYGGDPNSFMGWADMGDEIV